MGIVRGAWAAVDVNKTKAEIRDENSARRKKRRLLAKLVRASRSVVAAVRIEDLAPFPRGPLQFVDPNQVASFAGRADHNLSEILTASEEMLEDFDARTLLTKQRKNANTWAQVFIKWLARTYALLTGNAPTVSERKFMEFVAASYRSIRPDCGALDWEHQVETALGNAKKPRRRAKRAAKRVKP